MYQIYSLLITYPPKSNHEDENGSLFNENYDFGSKIREVFVQIILIKWHTDTLPHFHHHPSSSKKPFPPST